MAAHICLKNEFRVEMNNKKFMSWLIYSIPYTKDINGCDHFNIYSRCHVLLLDIGKSFK